MKDSKFFVLLRNLEAHEVPAFHKYLKQMHRGEDTALQIFEYARKLFPKPWDEKKLDLDYAFRKIFKSDISKQEHGRKKMLNTLSDLYLWLKDFLLSEKALRDPLTKQVLWMEILQNKRLKAGFCRSAARFYEEKNTSLKISKKQNKGYLIDLAASYFQFQHLSAVRPSPDVGAMQQCLDTLETSIKIIKLKMACEMATAKKIRPSDTAPALSKSAENVSPHVEPLLEIYEEIFQLIETGQDLHYNRIEQLLEEQADSLDPDEIHGIFSYLYNFVAIQIRTQKGRAAFFAEKLHQLNQFGLEHEVFKQAGEISLTQFTNIVNIACVRKDYEWAAKFIDQQNDLLEDHIRESVVQLAKATIDFDQKKYDHVLQLLLPKEYKDNHYIIRSRQLILRCYFELQEDIETTLDYCTTFEAWLLRNRKPKTGAVEAILEFVRVCKLILQERTDKETLIKRIEEKPSLYLRDWLLLQVTNYKGRSVTHKRRK